MSFKKLSIVLLFVFSIFGCSNSENEIVPEETTIRGSIISSSQVATYSSEQIKYHYTQSLSTIKQFQQKQ